MSENKSSSSGGGSLGFIGLLTIVFITLKLCKVIDWPWIWVLSPMWITAAVASVVIVAVFGIFFYIGWRQRCQKNDR